MGRLRKQTADYFPHFVGESRTKYILESTWGNDGYAFWFKLLELLSRSDGHYYDCSNHADMIYLTAMTKVPEETADKILDLLADMGKIDRELWTSRKVIWCQTLVDNLAGMYAKRTTPIPRRPSFENVAETAESTPEVPEDAGLGKTPEEPETPAEPPQSSQSGEKEAPRSKEDKKRKYAEFVSMTEAEYDKLIAVYGQEATARMIETLDNYKGSSGKKYKSDYRAILSWVAEKVRGDYQKGDRSNGSSTGFTPSRGFRG